MAESNDEKVRQPWMQKLSDNEISLVEAYAHPESQTWKQRPASMRAAGYSKSTVRGKCGQIFKRERIRQAIAKYLVFLGGHETTGNRVDDIKNLLNKIVHFNILDCFEIIEYTTEDLVTGKEVTIRRPQIADLVEANIDGRCIAKIKFTETKYGQTQEFEVYNKIQGARLLATLEGAMDEGATTQHTHNVLIQIGEGDVVLPAEVNNYLEVFKDGKPAIPTNTAL